MNYIVIFYCHSVKDGHKFSSPMYELKESYKGSASKQNSNPQESPTSQFCMKGRCHIAYGLLVLLDQVEALLSHGILGLVCLPITG